MVTLEDHIDLFLHAVDRATEQPRIKDPRSILVDFPRTNADDDSRHQPARTERRTA